MDSFAQQPDASLAEESVSSPAVSAPKKNALRWPYIGILLFALGYFARPEDWISFGRYVPLALIGGILALAGFAAHLIGGGGLARKREAMMLLALLAWFVMTIPFAEWPGGAFQELKYTIWKIFLLSIILTNVLNSIPRIRKLLVIQVISIFGMAWYAQSHVDQTGRAVGLENQFGNSNDLAVLICITVPFALFLVFTSRNYIVKGLYLLMIGSALHTLVLTYSRTGFICFIVLAAMLAWNFGWKKGHRATVVIGAFLFFAVFLVLAPKDYGALMKSIVSSDTSVGEVRADAAASRQQRTELMSNSIRSTFRHPLFGVGPDGFMLISGNWHVSHNMYLQFSTEGGIPALIFFLILVKYTFSNLRQAEQLSQQDKRSDIWLLTAALRTSFITMLVGALFSNFAYNFFPYLLIAYCAAVDELALKEFGPLNTAAPDLQPVFQN